MALTLHIGDHSNKNGAKALIAAEYVGVQITVPAGFKMGVSNRTPEFLKMNPLGKIPVLETADGAIFESNSIARYVARLKPEAGLYGSTLIDAAHVDQWIDFATNEIESSLVQWLGPRFGIGRCVYTKKGEELALAAVKRALAALNTYLASVTFLVGDVVTLADIVLVANLSLGIKTGLTKEFLVEFPHVERYFWTAVNQPAFKKWLGEVSHGQRPVPPPPAEGEIASRLDAAPPAATQPAEAAPTPKAPTRSAAQTVSASEEDEAPKKKPKNALDLLPPSTMVLDDWKRLYSNTKAKDFAEVAIKGFWEMYDAEGYSLWFCDYKYNEENTISYVTMNKVGGFLQRMDFIRKYAFAKICILGDAPYKIKGVWLFRGPDIPQLVQDECYDLDLYEWTKVDITDEAQKARVNAYFEEPDEIDGDKLVEAKCFK